VGIPEGSAPEPPIVRTITIQSVNPNSGVTIFASPVDLSDAGPPPTPFTRRYNSGTAAYLIAPATAGGNNFQKWQRGGVDLTTNVRVDYTADADSTYTAVFVSPAPPTTFTISIASTQPSSGVAITVNPADNNTASNGITPFTRVYNKDASVTLTAPATASGNNFVQWNKNGTLLTSSQTTIHTVTAADTLTAVYLNDPGPPVKPAGGPRKIGVKTVK